MNPNMSHFRPVIGISMGDPAGIGPEICAKVFAGAALFEQCQPLVVGDASVMEEAVGRLGLPITVHSVQAVSDGYYRYGWMDVLDLKNVVLAERVFGQASVMCGKAAFEAVKTLIELAMKGEVDATVTAPINKAAIQLAGHHFSGHTEIYAHFTHTKNYAMLLADDQLRIIHVTTHVSLRQACDLCRQERVLEVIRLLDEACRQLGIAHPRRGVAGLNPHAGEGGLFGEEEEKEIIPAFSEAARTGIQVEGPVPPDTLFVKAVQGKYDGCVAMYHDQGHIPFKLEGFTWDNDKQAMSRVKGVNITLGLPIIRTSVDHGTAFEIAGQGIASPEALEIAIDYAIRMAINRHR